MINWGFLEKRFGSFYNWTGHEHVGEVVEVGGKYWEPYPQVQFLSLAKLVSYLCWKHEIPFQYPPSGPGVYYRRDQDLASFRGLLGHSAVNSSKSDPGLHFDWDALLRFLAQVAP